ncbi:DCD (Development and Cell Death) domain protein [Raphanus sativus]|uniref:Uncharacterized protein LOC108857970 n=1 Tax=Raphanus sativus TaxID=3726 RepID=A0A6J0NRS8_RAPSA|nr:uncharacterized protein LOC108857970 [Raphanus sativus]KAJ4893330.1 DCD (Development and Cell Death) domain protein [Raphanus sativus]
MGAGRKTETYKQEDVQNLYGTMSVRKLQKGDLCAVIFGCKFSTIKECLAKNLFGLPGPHMAYIKNIEPGLTLFLFNYSDRTLHGVFEAASEGKLNIDPKAWSHNGTDPSPYPAQVKVRVRAKCEPLVEETFGPVIADNYKDEKIFWFELDRVQTNKLLRLFKPSPNVVRAPPRPSTSKYVVASSPSSSRKAIPASSLVEIGDSGGGAPRVDKWSSLFKSSENKGQDSKDGVVNLGKTNECEVVAQKHVSQSGPSYSSVLRNAINKSSARHEAPSQASKGVMSSRQAENVVVNWDQQSFHPTQNGTSAVANNMVGPSKRRSAEDTYSEIDWDAASNFQAHLKGLNMILEDKDGYNEGNTGFASSSMMHNHWEDDQRVSWEYEEENNIDKSSCGGSSYVTAMSGDAFEDDGEEKEKLCMDVLSEIWAEVKDMKQTQMKQAEYMISLQMELLETRKEILRLKGLYGSS